jgi:hypothetical protein
MNAAWKAGDDPLAVLKARTRTRKATATPRAPRAAKKATSAAPPPAPARNDVVALARSGASIRMYHSGGTVAEIPHAERIRRWPNDPTPREVQIRISTFVGRAFNAQHYTLRIEEEENPFLRIDDKGEPYYHKAWDDREADGFRAEMKFTSRDTAERVAEAMVGIMFADEKKYAVRFTVGAGEVTRAQWNKKYRLPREGD